jgi:hypothetical protein
MSSELIDMSWHLIDANDRGQVGCMDLSVTEAKYEQMILESLLSGETGIVVAPNGQRVYAEVT